METREKNAKMWEDMYGRNEGLLSYPDEVFVRIAHRLLDPRKHHVVLDYGFGSGSNMIHLIKRGHELFGAEVSDSLIEKVGKRLKDLQFKAELRKGTEGKLPFEDKQFDAVIAWLVLYYNDWDSFREAICEIDRVLKPGGMFLATMAAPGDYTHTHSIPLGDRVFRSTVPGQEGAVVIIVDEDDLQRCFPGKKITKGRYGFEFGEMHVNHWIISYEK